ncbi:ABC transporter thiamine pyrophosphate-binding lipoprotein p37/Cypl [Mycoplasma buteonis]|uniref:ABC transporter thiamine pyrophosphate-binding lipoprotein p37/Cypl n=1 Tax=Mycoplasma buteonis TaxID=171280 RepID=UPI00055CEB98|nr:hypothetical protein [Mycoplasma buteonis]
MKKLQKFFKSTALLIPLSILPVVVSAACDNQSSKIYKLELISNSKKDKTIWKTKYEKLFNDALAKNGSKAKVEVSFGSSDDYNNTKTRIEKNEIDFGLLSSGSLFNTKNELDKSGISVILQTLTNKFAGENPQATYSSEPNGSALVKSAQNEFAVFSTPPYETWGDTNWNGSIYTNAYDVHKENDKEVFSLVDYQRGLFVISATDEIKAKIIKAWNDKNLTEFLSYGIAIGSPTSGSKYLLPEKLMKKHFGATFSSFLALKNNDQYKNFIRQSKLKNLNDTENLKIHIFLENEGFYGYNKTVNGKLFKPGESRPGESLFFLTLTDPLPYNVGVASNRITKSDAKIIVDALIELSKKGEDDWGPSEGFNSYEFYDNDNDFWNKLNETLG